MEVNGDLVFVENVVKNEQIVECLERDGVEENLGVQETLELIVLFFSFDVFFQWMNIEVSFSIPKLVVIVSQVEVWEFILKVDFRGFEWSVIYQW